MSAWLELVCSSPLRLHARCVCVCMHIARVCMCLRGDVYICACRKWRATNGFHVVKTQHEHAAAVKQSHRLKYCILVNVQCSFRHIRCLSTCLVYISKLLLESSLVFGQKLFRETNIIMRDMTQRISILFSLLSLTLNFYRSCHLKLTLKMRRKKTHLTAALDCGSLKWHQNNCVPCMAKSNRMYT